MERTATDTASGTTVGPRSRSWGHAAALALVLVAGATVRAYRIGDPPLDFHPTRQYRSALLARRYYLESASGVSAWRREMAELNAQERYEFPLLQRLAAVGYRVAGGEDLRIPRLLSALAWLAGGVFLYLAASRIAGRDGALAATALFVLLPFGVAASRAFQPDAVMVALLALSYLVVLGWADRGGFWRVVGAGVSCGVTSLVKPMAVFQLVAAFGALWIARRRGGRNSGAWEPVVFLLVTGAIAAPYYVAQWYQSRTLAAVAELSFIPSLLVTGGFWKGWLAQIWKVVGFAAPATAVLGYLSLPRGAARTLLGGLAIGYSSFALLFSYPAYTHDYYHLQLVPLVALASAPFAARVAERMREVRVPLLRGETLLAALFVAATLDLAVFSYYRERAGVDGSEIAIDREVGALVGHSAGNVLLANYYAYPLRYYGELGGEYWPLSFDARAAALLGKPRVSAAERLARIAARRQLHYFIATDLPELAAQPDLARYLAASFAVRAATDRYVIYDLTTPARGAEPRAPR